MQSLKSILKDGEGGIYEARPKSIHLSLPQDFDARKILWNSLCYFLKEKQDVTAQWVAEYEEIASWLQDNAGKGLFLYGTCGRGKTVLAKWVIPALLLYYHRKVCNIVDAVDLQDRINEIRNKRFVIVDDLGCEPISQFKTLAFGELIDSVEKQGSILIVTTNLNAEELIERYGDRVMDRIKATTKAICFQGDSMRS